MKLDNTAFLIEKLASDCAPLQFVRELTSNSLQAIQARRESGWAGDGRIIWDVDWAYLSENPSIFEIDRKAYRQKLQSWRL